MGDTYDAVKEAHFRAMSSGHTCAVQEVACMDSGFAYYYDLVKSVVE